TYGEALALAKELEMRPLEARVHLSLGLCHKQRGERELAEEHLSLALPPLREMDIRFWARQAAEGLMGLGQLLIVARNNVQLYEYLKQEFAGESVKVVLDRRDGERRQRDGGPAQAERAPGDRRQNPGAEEVLQTRGFTVPPGS